MICLINFHIYNVTTVLLFAIAVLNNPSANVKGQFLKLQEEYLPLLAW